MKNRIREIITERGISQKELANAVGMTENGISKALDGSATKATITKIASFLSVKEVLKKKLYRKLYMRVN